MQVLSASDDVIHTLQCNRSNGTTITVKWSPWQRLALIQHHFICRRQRSKHYFVEHILHEEFISFVQTVFRFGAVDVNRGCDALDSLVTAPNLGNLSSLYVITSVRLLS